MPRYDSVQFDPPAPIAEVTLRNPRSGESIAGARLLLDTGADVTLLPHSVVARLSLVPDVDQQFELAGFDGYRTFADSVVLDMTFLAKTFRGRYLLGNEESDILGRDVLNYFLMVFDGPTSAWREGV